MESADGHSFKKEWWLSGGILLGAFLAAAVALYLLAGDLAAQSAKIAADRAFIAQENAVLGNFAALKSDAQKAAPYTNAMNQLLPTHDALIGFQSWLNTLAGAHNVSVSSAFSGANAPATDAAPGSDGFSLRATGAEEDLVAFLGDMEAKSQQYLVAIDSFGFVNEGGNYALSAQGRVFSR